MRKIQLLLLLAGTLLVLTLGYADTQPVVSDQNTVACCDWCQPCCGQCQSSS